jgi:predicted transcriptional regulator
MKIKDIKSNDDYIILSLNKEYFEMIKDGNKKYEYRRRFKKTPTYAFIYVPGYKKSIQGLIRFGEPIYSSSESISEFAETMGDSSYESMIEYLEPGKMGYAIPINELYLFESVSIQDLNDNNIKFHPPQLYSNVSIKSKIFDFLGEFIIVDKVEVLHSINFNNKIIKDF